MNLSWHLNVYWLILNVSVWSCLITKKKKKIVQTHFVQSNCQRLLTVSSDQGFDALAPPLAESVHHKEQQREDEEGRDAADDESHPAGHGVKKTVSI